MKDLYSEKDIQQLSSQLKKRYLLLGVILAVLVAAFIVSMIIRVEWLSMVLFFLFCAVAVFVIELFCLPLHRYKKLVSSALTGRNHTETLEYKEAEADPSVVDGVKCRGLIFLGNPDKHGSRDVLLYWDKELSLPELVPGNLYTVRFTGKNIIGIQ